MAAPQNTTTLTPDLSQCLVAYAGEVIACPECFEPLAVFEADAYGRPPFPLESLPGGTWMRLTARQSIDGRAGRTLRCRRCGSSRPTASINGEPRIHLSTGWRALGGE